MAIISKIPKLKEEQCFENLCDVLAKSNQDEDFKKVIPLKKLMKKRGRK